METLLASTREPSPWPSVSVSVTPLVPSHPTSTGQKMHHGTSLDVGYKPPSKPGITPLTPFTDGVELGLVCMGLAVLPIIVVTYTRVNARREAILKEAGESGGLQYTNEELKRMGDKSPCFRYEI